HRGSGVGLPRPSISADSKPERLLAPSSRQELSRSRGELGRSRQQRIEAGEHLLAAVLERAVAGLDQPGEEICRAQEGLVRLEQLARGAASLLREDEPGGEESRKRGAVAIQYRTDAGLGELAATKLADRREIDDIAPRLEPPRL